MPKKKLVLEDGMEIELPVPWRIGKQAYNTIKVRGLRGGDLRRASMLLERKRPDYSAYAILLRAGIEEVPGYGAVTTDTVMDMPWVDAEVIYHYMTLLDLDDPEEPVTLFRPCASCGEVVTLKVPLWGLKVHKPKNSRFLASEDQTFDVEISTPITSVDKDGEYTTLTIGLVTVGDMIDMLGRATESTGELEYWHLLYMLYRIGPKEKGQFGMEVVEEMRPRDIRRILKEYYDNEPHIEAPGPQPCPRCGEEVTIGRIVYPQELLIRSPLVM